MAQASSQFSRQEPDLDAVDLRGDLEDLPRDLGSRPKLALDRSVINPVAASTLAAAMYTPARYCCNVASAKLDAVSSPGRVVDAGHQGGVRLVRSEPAMAAAVDAQQLAFMGHPFAPTPVARRPAGPDRPDGGLGEDPAEGPLGDIEALALGEQFGQVAVVDPGIRRRGKLDDAVTDRSGDALGRGPATVAVDQSGRTVGPIPSEQPADLADRQVQDPGRLVGRQTPGQDVVRTYGRC